MSAVQPFISGAISKTVNMPEDVSVEDVEQLHIDAWKMGLKAVAIYRDNCKVGQPLSMAKKAVPAEDKVESEVPALASANLVVEQAQQLSEKVMVRGPVRHELPRVRNSKIFKFTVAGSRGYAIVGEYDDGTPGELFISSAKMGSTLRGVMDAFGVSVSYGLQFGVPLKNYVRNFTNTSFAPAGITDDPDIRTASSIIDYIFRRLGKTYLNFDDQLEVGLASIDDMPADQTSLLGDTVAAIMDEAKQQVETVLDATAPSDDMPTVVTASTASLPQVSQPADPEPQQQKPATHSKLLDDAPLCFNCGNPTQRAGSCYVCTSCGSTTGCS
jgi:ribonucleoside-diphosphate reductase alpha chain